MRLLCVCLIDLNSAKNFQKFVYQKLINKRYQNMAQTVSLVSLGTEFKIHRNRSNG